MKKLILLILLINLTGSYSQTTSYWKIINLGITSDLYGVSQRFAVGDNGKIFYTGNGGLNWSQQNSNTTVSLRSVASNVSYSSSIAVGLNGTILRSTNNGLNWLVVNSGTINNLNAVFFVGASYCFVSGSNGTILKSTNAGLNWVLMNSGTNSNLTSIFSSGGLAYTCGSNGTVKKLVSLLDSVWQSVNITANVSLNGIYSASGNMTTVGDNGAIYKSTNAGSNWQTMSSPTSSSLKSIYGSWIVGSSGVVLNYSNLGQWVNYETVLSSDILCVTNVSNAMGNPNLFAVGRNGKLVTLQSDSSYSLRNLDGNNIKSYFTSRGVFDRNPYYYRGFEWPVGSNKYAVYTAGLTVAAYVNNMFRMSAASYLGEYTLGYCSQGVYYPGSIFRIYKVNRGDNQYLNRDWAEWGAMVPYGAPYTDVNNNRISEPSIDIPGIKIAKQTIFMCITDANPSNHAVGEGFGGGTPPIYSEVHFTAWCYDNEGYRDIQFLKWDIINKNTHQWNKTHFSIHCDGELGYADDDYMGCDIPRSLAYVYNGDNNDDSSSIPNGYGLNPPAVGIVSLNCIPKTLPVSSMITFITSSSTLGPACEKEPNGEPMGAYNLMRGLKKDMTPWVVPNTNPPLITKFCYSGDPESGAGWTELQGKIANCGGLLTGSYSYPNHVGDRNFVISHGSDNLTVNVNDTVRVLAAQLIARGSNNLNSVTLLKQLTDRARQLCQSGFVIGINPISNEVPSKFNLYQNYPNPFNPVTKIKFDLPKSGNIIIKIYDAIGREVSTLVNEKLNAGVYSVDWDGINYPSGVYFYQLSSGSYTETKKMVMVK